MKKKKIQWTPDETVEVAREALNIMRRTRNDILFCVNQAQEKVLPVSRRRELKQVQSLSQWTLVIIDLLSYRQIDSEVKDRVLDSLEDREIYSRFKSRILENLKTQDLLEHVPLETILESIPLSRLAGYLVSRYLESQTFDIPVVLQENVSVHEKREKKPKVVIIGPLNRQLPEIEKQLDGKVDCRFIDKDKVKSLPSDADLYVLWGDFVSHNLEDKLGKERVYVHRGGTGRMVKAIMDRV